ncbi:hypothetical protein ACIBG8_21290 [Nonomuraea sp. NPDC050556]|uniref:hypothetical protein n=1 Tax=Nonomuraea sp. NPDC050556 TaxID=3364369 RepID=UPI0037AF71BC
MDAMQVLAHQTAMGFTDYPRSALPGAPKRPRRRIRTRVARTLRHTADRLDPIPTCRAALG